MRQIKPMAAQDGTLHSTVDGKLVVTSKYIWDENYTMEPKLDGARYIAQWDESWKFYFTSRHTSVKDGLQVDKSAHAKLYFDLADAVELAGLILDGEVVVYEEADVGYKPVSWNGSSEVNKLMLTKWPKMYEALKNLFESKKIVQYDIYDILEWEWISVTNIVHEKRKETLMLAIQKVVQLFKSPINYVGDIEPTQENLEILLDYWYEGVMLKYKYWVYQEGVRSNDWVKVKKLITEDGIVMWATQGTGKYSNTIWALIIGQYIDNVLTEVCTISGMDDAQRDEWYKWLGVLNEAGFVKNADWKMELNEAYYIWWYKNYPLRIVEFIAQEKTKKRYRHPRFVQERLDKNYFECTF